jgi:hypothetical protein
LAAESAETEGTRTGSPATAGINEITKAVTTDPKEKSIVNEEEKEETEISLASNSNIVGLLWFLSPKHITGLSAW